MTTMHPYIGYSGDPSEGAALIFAHSAKQAKPLAFGMLSGWFDLDFTDVRVRRVRENEAYLLALANPEKLVTGTPHVIEDPPSCNLCLQWGSVIDENHHCARCAAECDAEGQGLS